MRRVTTVNVHLEAIWDLRTACGVIAERVFEFQDNVNYEECGDSNEVRDEKVALGSLIARYDGAGKQLQPTSIRAWYEGFFRTYLLESVTPWVVAFTVLTGMWLLIERMRMRRKQSKV